MYIHTYRYIHTYISMYLNIIIVSWSYKILSFSFISRISIDIKKYYLYLILQLNCPIFCTTASISQTTSFSSPPPCLHQLPKLMSADFQRRRHFHFHFHGKATFTQNRGPLLSLGPINLLHNSCLIVLLVQLLFVVAVVVRILYLFCSK